MELKNLSPEDIRQYLIAFAIILSYIVFLTIGMIIRKHYPIVDLWIDISFIPLGLSTLLFLYLFAITYEQRISVKLSDEIKEVGRLYGEKHSFQQIKDIMGLDHIETVRRMVQEFCKHRG